jgi:hypothetical protein
LRISKQRSQGSPCHQQATTEIPAALKECGRILTTFSGMGGVTGIVLLAASVYSEAAFAPLRVSLRRGTDGTRSISLLSSTKRRQMKLGMKSEKEDDLTLPQLAYHFTNVQAHFRSTQVN